MCSGFASAQLFIVCKNPVATGLWPVMQIARLQECEIGNLIHVQEQLLLLLVDR